MVAQNNFETVHIAKKRVVNCEWTRPLRALGTQRVHCRRLQELSLRHATL